METRYVIKYEDGTYYALMPLSGKPWRTKSLWDASAFSNKGVVKKLVQLIRVPCVLVPVRIQEVCDGHL